MLRMIQDLQKTDLKRKTERAAGRLAVLIAGLICLLPLAACSPSGSQTVTGTTAGTEATNTTQDSMSGTTGESESQPESVTFKEEDTDDTWSNSETATLTLAEDAITVAGSGAKVSGCSVTITAAGTYLVTGTLDDGQIIVDADGDSLVRIVLQDASVSCAKAAPIQVRNADKVVLILAAGTVNTLTDLRPADTAASDTTDDDSSDEETDEPNAALYSQDDLSITGTGALKVQADYQDGITCKDTLKISSGTITIDAADDGVRGSDKLAIGGAALTVTAGGDGLRASNDTDEGLGLVIITGGTVTVKAGGDGIQAVTNVEISGGVLDITAGSGSGQSLSASGTTSMKGIKSSSGLTISGGSVTIDSTDDAIHTNKTIVISGGTLTLASGDDGIHADESITIDSGDIIISKSYEGIESMLITINGGTIRVASSDDGINIAGGNDGSSMGGRPGRNGFGTSTPSNQKLVVSGGYIAVNAVGDGIDINGSVTMTGGTLFIFGPSANDNGALDYDNGFTLSGGRLLAVGSAGMAQTADSDSQEVMAFTCNMAAGTLMYIEDSDGNEVIAFEAPRNYIQLRRPQGGGNLYGLFRRFLQPGGCGRRLFRRNLYPGHKAGQPVVLKRSSQQSASSDSFTVIFFKF